MRTVIVIFLLCLCESVAFTQDDKQAVCKDADIPADRVAVAEFQSAGCTPPETNNAWDTVIPREGTKLCEERHINSTARVLELESCERVQSESCPAEVDGTKNAVVLRSPKSCLAKNGPGLQVFCYKDWNRFGSGPFNFGRFGYAVVASMFSPKCGAPKHPPLVGNAFVVRRRAEDGQPAKVGVTFKMCWFEHLEDAAGSPFLGETDVILRRFHSDFCNILVGAPTLNTVIVMGIDHRPSRDLIMCNGTPMSTPPQQPSDRNLPKFFYYFPDELQSLYSPLCGVDDTKQPNATRLVNPKHNIRDEDDDW